MDEFNDGVADPAAIRRFLAHAVATWARPPRFAVLAGDGSYDYRNRMGGGAPVVPPMLVPTPYGLFASDAWFADVDSDRVPEVAVGRLPVRTPGGLEALVAKIVAAEAADGPWRSAALFLADQSDDAGDFRAQSDELIALLPPAVTVTRRLSRPPRQRPRRGPRALHGHGRRGRLARGLPRARGL